MNAPQKAVARGGKYWARLCALPTFSFLLNDAGGVARMKDPCGNWIELSEVQQIVDDAQSCIEELEILAAANCLHHIEAVTSTAPMPALKAPEAIDWPSLVRYRLQFVETAVQARPAWLSSHVGVLATRLCRECESGQGRGALGRLAEEIGISRQAAAELLKKHRYEAATGYKISDAEPWTFPVEQEMIRFEAWARRRGYNTKREGQRYCLGVVNDLRDTWLEARRGQP